MADDPYSLGVLLYELLCGLRPYRTERGLAHEVELAICDHDPERPSSAVRRAERSASEPTSAHLGRLRGLRPAELERRLRGDLDHIVLKALRKEPAERYGSAQELARDIQRYFDARPVMARRGTWRYRQAKFLRRHRFGVAVAAFVVLLVVASFLAVDRQARQAKRERDKAWVVSQFLVEMFEISPPDEQLGSSFTARQLLELGTERLSREFHGEPDVRAALLETMSEIYARLDLLDEARSLVEESRELRRGMAARHDAELSVSSNLLASILHRQGKVDEAIALYQEVVDLYGEDRGQEIDTVTEAMRSLAIIRWDQGDWDQAESLLRRALMIRQRFPDHFRQRTALLRSDLAALLLDANRLEEAESLLHQAIETRRTILGSRHPVRTSGNLLPGGPGDSTPLLSCRPFPDPGEPVSPGSMPSCPRQAGRRGAASAGGPALEPFRQRPGQGLHLHGPQ